MALTSKQLERIRKLINNHFSMFILLTLGKDKLSIREKLLLRNSGIISKELNFQDFDENLFLDAFKVGKTRSEPDEFLPNLNYKQWKEQILQMFINDNDQASLDHVDESSTHYVRNLKQKVTNNFMTRILDANKEDILGGPESKQAIDVNKLAKELEESTGDNFRDWKKVAVTELNSAHSQGSLQSIKESNPGKPNDDIEVYCIGPLDGATCQWCRKFYHEGGSFKVYKLSELLGNGTNIGVKAAGWRAVVPPMHPNCRHKLVELPAGWHLATNGQMVFGVMKKSLKGKTPTFTGHKLHKRLNFQGMKISIENRKGSYRHWKDPKTGETGKKLMKFDYGYIRNTLSAADGDHVDCYIGPNKEADMVYIIHQYRPDTGVFDEDKCMLGFDNRLAAKSAYLKHIPKEWYGSTTTMTVDRFKMKVLGKKVDLIKGGIRLGGQATNHKYIKRTGPPGQYKYWYQDPKTGRIYSSDDPKHPSGQKPLHGTHGEHLDQSGMEQHIMERKALRPGSKQVTVSRKVDFDRPVLMAVPNPKKQVIATQKMGSDYIDDIVPGMDTDAGDKFTSTFEYDEFDTFAQKDGKIIGHLALSETGDEDISVRGIHIENGHQGKDIEIALLSDLIDANFNEARTGSHSIKILSGQKDKMSNGELRAWQRISEKYKYNINSRGGKFIFNTEGKENDFGGFDQKSANNSVHGEMKKFASEMHSKLVSGDMDFIAAGGCGTKGFATASDGTKYFIKSELGAAISIDEIKIGMMTTNEVAHSNVIGNVFPQLSSYFTKKTKLSNDSFMSEMVDEAEVSFGEKVGALKKIQAEKASDLHELGILDYVMGNKDRNLPNTVITANGNLKLIDEGLTIDAPFEQPDFMPAYLRDMKSEIPDYSSLIEMVSDENRDLTVRTLRDSGVGPEAIDRFNTRWDNAQMMLLRGEDKGVDNNVLFQKLFTPDAVPKRHEALLSTTAVNPEATQVLPSEAEVEPVKPSFGPGEQTKVQMEKIHGKETGKELASEQFEKEDSSDVGNVRQLVSSSERFSDDERRQLLSLKATLGDDAEEDEHANRPKRFVDRGDEGVINSAFDKSKLNNDTTVYRGLSGSSLSIDGKSLTDIDHEGLVGKTVTHDGYMHTSVDREVASQFSGSGEEALVLELSAKKGTNAINLDQFAAEGKVALEGELVFNKGHELKITGHRKEGNEHILTAEIIPKEEG